VTIAFFDLSAERITIYRDTVKRKYALAAVVGSTRIDRSLRFVGISTHRFLAESSPLSFSLDWVSLTIVNINQKKRS
jgi:hypothetical protein